MQPAYVLHTRDYRDTSLLIDLFTPEHGRISAVARGARMPRRGVSQRASLQPFQPLWIEWSGAGELKSLRESEIRDPAIPLRGPALFSGMYVNEILCRLLHRDDAHADLFSDYENALQQLAQQSMIDVVLRHFELRLLDELGYGFNLREQAHSGDLISATREYYLDVNAGLVAADVHTPAQIIVRGVDILNFLDGNYSPQARRAMKIMCRMALQPHLGSKPLMSRELFRV